MRASKSRTWIAGFLPAIRGERPRTCIVADLLMPDEIREWMQQRNWGVHHLEWHTSRQWDRLPLAARQWAAQQGWRRAALLEGEAGNGVEFLVMHRAMIELLREQFPQHAAL